MKVVKLILTNGKFWAAVVILANTILIYFVPDFPPTIWAAFDALVSIVLGTLAGVNIAADAKSRG